MNRKLQLRSLILLFTLLLSQIITAQQNNIITLDLSKPTNPPQITLNEKGYWTETYNTSEKYRHIEFGLFSLTHIPGAFGGGDVGGGMSYWDGFTYCTSGDNTDYGEAGSSQSWVAEQWGCMAGGGIKTDANGKVMTDESGKVLVQKGNPYLVAYWGYYQEIYNNGEPCLHVKFKDGKQYKPVGIYINNHPWPYYGNIHGDGFARPFDEGDYFKLFIHGFNEKGEDVGIAVEHILAEFKNGELQQSPDWEWVDLSALGTVSGIYFTMETTDADPIYGPNTAVYFCMDKLQVESLAATTTPSRPTGLSATPTETTIKCSWTASTSSVGVKGYNLYLNGLFKTFVENTEYTFSQLQPYTSYKIEVEAVANNNTLSEKALMAAQTTDETAPIIPVNLTGTSTQYTISLTWDASSDNVAVTEYHIYLNGERQKRVYTTSYTLTGLDANTDYLVEVEARDAAGNKSAKAVVNLKTKNISTGIFEGDKSVLINYTNNYIMVENLRASHLQLYAINGQLLYNYQIPTNGIFSINISQLQKGIYILKAGQFTQKIIKQ
ncbi:MAG: DUF4465 domain-containing protein [Paludibacteraceae bacterium]